MTLLTIPERVELLKNLLDDPFDWVSKEILRLADEHDRLEAEKAESGSSKAS